MTAASFVTWPFWPKSLPLPLPLPAPTAPGDADDGPVAPRRPASRQGQGRAAGSMVCRASAPR